MANEDRSFDVLSLMLLDAHQANTYESKHKLTHKVEYVLERVREADVYDRGKMQNLLKVNSKGNPQLKEGDSNVYKALESMIENRLYDIKTTGDPKLGKIAASIKKYVSIASLFGNYLSGGANLTQGMSMVFMEGAGSKFYKVKNVRRASAKYGSESVNIMADAGRRQPLAKVNLLMELFNANSGTEVIKAEYSKNSVFKREANVGAGLIANQSAEHIAQGIGMLSVLDNIKVKNAEGQYMDKEGNVVEDREKAMSLDEAYSSGFQNKNTSKTISAAAFNELSTKEKKNYFPGVLHLDTRVASTDRTEEGVNTFAVSQAIRRVNRDLFGNYDRENRSKLERLALGSLVTHMRGWMIPAINKRWRGANTLWMRDKEASFGIRTIKNHELRPEIDLFYNQETQSFEEGQYVSTLRYASSILEHVKALKFSMMSQEWKSLTDMEKKNIHKTLVELGMVALAMITFAVLEGLRKASDEPEDEFALILASFYARRLQSELLTYVDPREWQRTLRSPAVSLNMMEKVTDAIIQTVSDPLEEYKVGDYKGQNKALKKWIQTTPAKAWYRDPMNSLKWYIN